jgi:hypothetical protein
VLPTLPPEPAPPAAPKKGGGCGILGKILLAVVAIAVVAILHVPIQGLVSSVLGTTGAAAGSFAAIATGVVSGAITGAAASIVSQGVGVITGLQDSFSWKAVGLAAIGGGVGGGIQGAGILLTNTASLATNVVNGVVRGALSNAITQGIAVGVGLQDKFDWTGVAVGAVVGGITPLAAKAFNVDLEASGNIAGKIAVGLTAAIAGAATRSAIDGTDFGDNVLAALPDVIGATVGNAIGMKLNDKIAEAKLDSLIKRLEAVQNGAEIKTKDAKLVYAAVRNLGDPEPGKVSANLIKQFQLDLIAGKQVAKDVVSTALDYARAQKSLLSLLPYGSQLKEQERTATLEAAGSLLDKTGNFLIDMGGKKDLTRIEKLSPKAAEIRDYLLKNREQIVGKLGANQDRLTTGLFDYLPQDTRLFDQAALTYKLLTFNVALRNFAAASIDYTLQRGVVTDRSREILTAFRSGVGPREVDYSNDRGAASELLNSNPGKYVYPQQQQDALKYLSNKLLNREKRTYFKDGDTLTDYTGSGTFGLIDGTTGLLDGIQLPDVVGSLSEGLNATVSGSKIYFDAKNNTSLTSFNLGNILPFTRGDVITPLSGPFSTVTQKFSWDIVIPPEYQPRPGK